jgi:hypothetical protein
VKKGTHIHILKKLLSICDTDPKPKASKIVGELFSILDRQRVNDTRLPAKVVLQVAGNQSDALLLRGWFWDDL